MSKVISKFSFNDKTYPIVITWSLAYNTLPEKFNIEILKLFVDEQLTQQTTNRILVDDDLCLRLCWFFIEPQVQFDWDKFLELLDQEPEAIENFRETFWSAIVNFSSPQKKGILGDMWKMLKKEMKQLSLDMDKSSRSLSESNPEE
jgi:hypothetical protein